MDGVGGSSIRQHPRGEANAGGSRGLRRKGVSWEQPGLVGLSRAAPWLQACCGQGQQGWGLLAVVPGAVRGGSLPAPLGPGPPTQAAPPGARGKEQVTAVSS